MDKKLPADIRQKLVEIAKIWMLNNYVGGRKRLEAWSDHYAHLTSIHSYDLPGGTGKNLRRLTKLAAEGVLVEEQRYRPGIGTRRFKPQPDELNEIGMEAQRYWESVGYRVGELVPKIAEPAPKEAP